MSNEIQSRVKIEKIRQLDIYEPTCLKNTKDVIRIKIASKIHKYGITCERGTEQKPYHHYPFVVDPDGSLWVHANRFLLSRSQSAFPVNHRTLECNASDLVHFRKWLLDEEIDYLRIPKRIGARPTYKYCHFLHDEVKFGDIKNNTAKRRMCCVQSFYRWLIKEGYEFDYPLWLEKDSSLFFGDSKGFPRNKKITTTDLSMSFKSSRAGDDYSEYIDDGGKLRPLPKDEQVSVVESLVRIGNPEMFIAFCLALTTGARIQTIFTLRQINFLQTPRKGAIVVRVKIGKGTLIDTKYGKQMVILIPTWLYQRIRIYINSKRYLSRVKISKHIYISSKEQYVFITRQGRPYYLANNDSFRKLYRTPPRGNSVTQFIRQQLKPDLAKYGFEFEFRFHDLRATFGMNLIEDKLDGYKLGGVVNASQPELFHVLMYVKQRMGHSQLKTTESYVNYRQNFHLAVNIQSEFEIFLKEMSEYRGCNNVD